MERTKSIVGVLLIFFSLSCKVFPCCAYSCNNAPYYGATLSAIFNGKEPSRFRGVQLMVNYDPQLFCSNQFNIYFDGGVSHFWTEKSIRSHYSNIEIISAAPVVRYTVYQGVYFHPYLELSVGLAYLNHTRFGNRNLGIHFAFQDRLGFGVAIGQCEQISIGLHAEHYSNAHLSSRNSGITAPLVLDIGYRFQ